VIFAERHKTGGLDLEAVEMALGTALHAAGAAGLSELLRLASPTQPSPPCSCGSQARFKGMRTKPLLTVLGPAGLLRPYYWCSDCHQGQFPSDAALDVEDTECSPGVRRMLALVGRECSSFERGREQMDLLAGLEVTAKAVERVTESIGADIARREQETIRQAMQLELSMVVGRPIPAMYVQMDGTGVPVAPKETEGWPVRDEESTTCTGAIETAAEFSGRIYIEAFQRGWSRAEKKVVMGDGAEWIWNIRQEQFPGAIEIVDLFHARQHLWDLGAKLHPRDEAAKRRWGMAARASGRRPQAGRIHSEGGELLSGQRRATGYPHDSRTSCRRFVG